MSKLLLDLRTPDLHPAPQLPDPRSPLSLVDRASLHLGLWLLLRSARSASRRADHHNHARLLANEQARLAREAAALRLQHLRPHL
ncbi:hypothetical protein GCM10009775_03150 [Microbacterium aoyamense]|uniref:Uncharacterized protein n=1 Tax=Microbacterium aoyamense TaxID=344166 RepID=A0ABN2P6D9_9MICO|nr:hypothetical protein [Microbacterium aoyamense]